MSDDENSGDETQLPGAYDTAHVHGPGCDCLCDTVGHKSYECGGLAWSSAFDSGNLASVELRFDSDDEVKNTQGSLLCIP